MKEIQLGKVMLTFKGEYDSTKSYTRLDAVTYQGSSYVCLSDTSSAPPGDSWQLLADKGATGDVGPQGLPGKDGVTPHIDSTTGDWFIGNQDTGTQAQGPAGKNGKDGVDGQPGKDGQNGITPHIDTATGNWFVGSTDTGIKAQGPQGQQGNPGKDGQAPDVSKLATEDELAGYYPQKVITTGTVDFNTLTGSGEYFVGTKCTNGPTDGSWDAWYYVFVSGDSGSRVSQLVFLDNTNRSYYRRKTNATWSDWVALANFSDIGDQLGNYYTKSQTDSAIDKIQIGGRNLVAGTAEPYTMGYGIPNTTWQNGYAYESLPTKILTGEILPQNYQFFVNLVPGQEYTQTIWFETDADVKKLNAAITWFNNVGHDKQPAKIIKVGENSYKLFSTYTWPGKTDNNVRLFDIFYLQDAFDLSTGTYIKFGKLKLEEGNVSTDWTPAPEDFDTKLDAKVDKSELVDYAKKSDIPASADLSGYATISSLIDYVKKTDLPDFTLFAKKSDIPVEQDLSNYAKKDDLNKYVTNETYSQNKTSLENTIQNLRTSLSNQNQVKTITSGTLADLASAQGSYHYEIDFVPSDGPASDWGLLDVVVGEHYAKQVFTNTGATGDNLGNVYIRTRGYGSTSWSEWREITLWQ